MKRFASILLALSLVFSLSVGCAEGAAAFDNYVRPNIKSQDEIVVAFLRPQLTSEWTVRAVTQVELEFKNRGWKSLILPFETDAEVNDLILSAVNNGVDAIVLCNMETMEAKQNAIKTAREAGIGVYNVDNQVVDGVIANVTMPNGVAAAEMMYILGEKMKWTGGIASLTVESIQVHNERTRTFESIIGCYAGLKLLDNQDCFSGAGTYLENCYDMTTAWLNKYGTDLNGIICSADAFAIQANAAAEANANEVNPDLWIAGIDGGSEYFFQIRKNSYYQYSYVQPVEYYVHTMFDVIEDIQVQGLNPGQEGCLISRAGETLYCKGTLVGRDNVPQSGDPIQSVFDYYTDDPTAWYNWEGGYVCE